MTSVNIIYRDNGLGLSRDFRILAQALRANGCEVAGTGLTLSQERWRRKRRSAWLVRASRWWRRLAHRPLPRRFDINVMLEHLWPRYLDSATCNVALPNPEWFDRRDMRFLRDVDLIWAKSHNGERIYQQLGCATCYIGFSSDDRFDPATPRVRSFLHLAGGSRIKGTQHTMQVWARHPEWPMLTVLQDPSEAKPGPTAANITHRIGYLDSAKPDDYRELRRLQNSHAFHVCLSETDAWGHYLVEALSVGAVTLTTDAPPMNELITPERGVLVGFASTGTMALATTYYFDESALVRAVERVLALSADEQRQIGARARAWFEDNQRTFVARVASAVQAAVA